MSTQQTLRRIDEEITFNRQQIARLQVDIVRLEDTRRVLMGLEEADAQAAAHRKADRENLIAGSAGKPVLIVRPTTDEKPKKSRRGGARKRGSESVSGKMRERILAMMKPGGEPMTSSEIGTALGIPKGDEPRKPLNNALYTLRVSGSLKRDEAHRYYVPPSPNGAAAAH